MARELITLGGAAVGLAFGSPQLGFLIGSVVGNLVDPLKIKGPSLGDAKVQTVQEGSPIPRVWGRAAVAGTVVDTITPYTVRKKVSGGKGAPKQTEERMFTSFAIAFSEPVKAITRIWENDKLVYDTTSGQSVPAGTGIAGKFTFYPGGETQLPDSTFEAVHGVGNAPAYRGVSRVVFADYDVTEKGQAIPRYLFEVAENTSQLTHYGQWWLYPYNSESDSIKFSDDAIAWGGTSSRAPFATGLLRTVATSTTIIAMGAGSVVEVTPQVAGAPITPVLVSIPFSSVFNTIIVVDDIAIIYGSNGFQFSTDGGFNWTIGIGPSIYPVLGINRIRGRWVVYWFDPSAGISYAYSDSALPVGGWVSASVSGASGSPTHKISYDGIGDAFHIGNGGRIGRTTDGSSWVYSEQLGDPIQSFNFENKTASVGGVWLAGAGGSTEGGSFIWRSTDNGVTWSKITVATGLASVCLQLTSSNSLVAATFTAGLWISADTGLTWVQADSDGLAVRAAANDVIVSVDPDTVPLSQIVTDIYASVGITASEIDVSELTSTMVTGFAYAGAYPAAEAIRELAKTFLFVPYAADGKIWHPMRGGAALFAITDDDLLEDPDILERKQEVELPRALHLMYANASQNYSQIKATSKRTSPDVRVTGETQITSNVTLTETEAANIAAKLHKVTWVELEGEFTIKIADRKFAFITPGDPGTVTFRGITKRVLVQKAEAADGIMTLTVTHDRQSAYQADVIAPVLVTPQTPADDSLGVTVWQWLNIPALIDSQDRLGYYIAAASAGGGWRGYVYQTSVDGGAIYTERLTGGGAVMGTLTATFGAASEYYFDDTNTLTVQLVNIDDTLDSITYTQLLQDNNAAIVGDEIIQFQTATQISKGVCELTGILRGRFATTATSHAAGERFVMLDGASFLELGSALINSSITHRAIGIGDSAENATVRTDTWTPARSQEEFAPAYLTLTRATNDVSATWIQRHRFGSSVAPLASVNFTGYRVTITGPSGSTTFDTTATATGFDPVDTTALGSPVTVTVAGLNRITGASTQTAQGSI